MNKSASQPLKNVRWERFAQGVASGKAQSVAYRDAGYRALGNASEVRAASLIRKAQVKARVAHLRAKQDAKSEFGRDDLRKWYCRLVNKDRKATRQEKIMAARDLAKLCGWNDEKPLPPMVNVIIAGDATIEE